MKGIMTPTENSGHRCLLMGDEKNQGTTTLQRRMKAEVAKMVTRDGLTHAEVYVDLHRQDTFCDFFQLIPSVSGQAAAS